MRLIVESRGNRAKSSCRNDPLIGRRIEAVPNAERLPVEMVLPQRQRHDRSDRQVDPLARQAQRHVLTIEVDRATAQTSRQDVDAGTKVDEHWGGLAVNRSLYRYRPGVDRERNG